MNLNLRGKRALVCGSTGGIGFAAARELALLGASVTLLARDPAKLAAKVAELPTGPDAGQRHDTLAADLGRSDEACGTVRAALDEARPWLILVNNAGGPPPGPAADAQPEALRAAFETLVLTPHGLTRLLAPGMAQAGYGRVVNISSTSIKQPIPNLAISNIVRPAAAAWAKCLATELGPRGVTVNNVLPGYTDTERLDQLVRTRAAKQGVTDAQARAELAAATPLGRLGTPEEIGAAIAFLCTPAAGYISGINLPVDGGRLGTL